MAVPPELLQALTSMIAGALQTAAANAVDSGGDNPAPGMGAKQLRPPPFSMTEYRPSDRTTIEDYFKRFTWALQLSNVLEDQRASYARVYMGTELNNALKSLVSPRGPETLTYDEIRTTLIGHFDHTKNKFAESIKFRRIVQHKEETVANFALRLREGAAGCEYDAFLDRMLIEQLLFGLDSREMCDEIIAKKPATFAEAYEIAHALEATHYTASEVKTTTIPNNGRVDLHVGI